jgi:hypothetical protein
MARQTLLEALNVAMFVRETGDRGRSCRYCGTPPALVVQAFAGEARPANSPISAADVAMRRLPKTPFLR